MERHSLELLGFAVELFEITLRRVVSEFDKEMPRDICNQMLGS